MTATRTTLSIHAVPHHGVSADLWGIFLEDLNHALDGGLNAEKLVNGDFEYTERDRPGWGPLTGWRVHAPAGDRRVWVRHDRPIHRNNPTYLRVEGPAVLRNEGWQGVGVKAGTEHRLVMAQRVASGSGVVSLSVKNFVGEALTTSVEVAATPGDWSWAEADLSTLAEGRGHLELDVPAGLTVDIDCVSLRELGPARTPRVFREDLLDALRDLRPSFVRFPGGCLVHGRGTENIYNWKNTIGPLHTRVQAPNLWGYHQSMAIGYLEYFQLCDELGATPVPVVAAGVCCQNTPGGPRALNPEEMKDYVQDVIDLIEFAKGAVDTFWGRRRAELGHPEPFNLRYLGVGNEDEITREFEARYAQIEDAVRAHHPEVTVIGTAGPSPSGLDFERGWEFARERGTAIVDEHFYRSPLWFHQNVDRYDGYSRTGPGVYIGEYAARSNTVRSAIAEAAFMIGIENNSDIVRLASYAPLLARLGSTQWEPDLIYFDADDVVPSMSYHVQRMFSRERGTHVHRVELPHDAWVEVPPLSRGELALHTVGSSFRAQDVRINGEAVADIRFSGTSPAAFGIRALDGLEIEAVLTRTEGLEGVSLTLGDGLAGEPGFEVLLGGWENKSTSISRRQHGIAEDIAEPVGWAGFSTDVPVHVRVAATADRIRVWVDGELRHDLSPNCTPERRFVAGATSRSTPTGNELIVRIVNALPHARSVALAVEGRSISSVRGSVLEGEAPQLGEAGERAPVEQAVVARVGNGVADVEVPAWSFLSLVLRMEVIPGIM